jgi:hypothetical protein
MKKWLFIFLVLGLIAITGCTKEQSSIEKSCTNSGGKVSTAMCCKSATDFPNSCLIGACGCSLDNSHEVKVCDCGEGKCFDGSKCVVTN